MRFDFILIGLLIFGIFMVGGVMLMNDSNSNYGFIGSNYSSSDMNDILVASNSTINDINTMTDSFNNKTLNGDTSTVTPWDSLIQGSYSSVRLIANSFGMVSDLVSIIGGKLGIPKFVINIFVVIFIIGVIFSVIYMIFRFRP